MKVVPLLVFSASALETSTSATDLLATVGHRNVTHMESLVQGLVEESIHADPDLKLDKDIRDALTAIRTMFVKSIQDALLDQHKVSQEAHNCGTKECFASCTESYTADHKKCESKIHDCHNILGRHEECRGNVYNAYKDMAIKCSKLHCFEPPKVHCKAEKCLCPDVQSCSSPHEDPKTGEMECEATVGNCVSDSQDGYGAWLESTIKNYENAHDEWKNLHGNCTKSYRDFLLLDIDCDGVQKEFETCMCEKSTEEEFICSTTFSQCNEKCRDIYDFEVPNLQCQEKDRKIDWSATKKIECYLDVLMYNYNETILLNNCGKNGTCINVIREEKYRECHDICVHTDHQGVWPNPRCTDDGKVTLDHEQGGHAFRKFHGQYHLGDTDYKCDENGPEVFTEHRGPYPKVQLHSPFNPPVNYTVSRGGEQRCTEHLDIDYQIPRWQECVTNDAKVCDADFHCKYYKQFDDTSSIGCISDCCPEGGGGCHSKQKLLSCDGEGAYGSRSLTEIKFGEHTHAWAYNRCPCKGCSAKIPSYPGGEAGRGKCTGVHTPGFGSGAYAKEKQ